MLRKVCAHCSHLCFPCFQGRWHCAGQQFADVNVANRVAHGGDGVMLWAGVFYGTQVHFIDGVNAQR